MGENLIFGIIGFVAGAIVGGLTIGHTCAKAYRRRIEDLESERDQLIEERRKTASRASESRLRALQEAEKLLDENLSTIGKKEAAKKAIKEYRGEDSEDSEDDDLDLDDEDFDFNDPFGDDSEDGEIRMLTKEEFDKELSSRESFTMTYYQEDGILTDENQDIVHEQASILGEEAMGLIDDTTRDTLYIDNGPDEALYEIVVEHSLSYYRDVLGM